MVACSESETETVSDAREFTAVETMHGGDGYVKIVVMVEAVERYSSGTRMNRQWLGWLKLRTMKGRALSGG